eukprot:TRINITY_DN3338_c0_g1_i1.p1 TRINITY_DN3338_c0_g1~~TRINITY_DN3338_c0_g1_i1.p1  ORF type:complete len:254 (-),score=50.41 TRINITY_DN3338_c0_g1_i1:113-814(-)
MRNETLPNALRVVTQVSILTSLGLLCGWIFYYNDQAANELFRWHPFCMGLSFIVLMAEAVTVYHTLPWEKQTQKLIHLIINTISLLTATAGLVVVLRYHEINKFPDFYSMHSWMGVFCYGLFALQYLIGFYSFWYPRPKESIRRQILPFHVFLGVAVFALGAATTCSGILEKITFLEKTTTPIGFYSAYAMVGNLTGISFIITALTSLLYLYVRRAITLNNSHLLAGGDGINH